MIMDSIDSWPSEAAVGYGLDMAFAHVSYFQEIRSRSKHEKERPRRRRQFCYDWNHSTEENYRSDRTSEDDDTREVSQDHSSRYRDIRAMIDYSYHARYSLDRQLVQDKIIDTVLSSTPVTQDDGNDSSWIVFTAGPMGAGKTFTTRYLQQRGKLPLGNSFVTVDPDDLRCQLPEYATYVERNAETAGEQTQKEAGMISEILTMVALKRGQSVLVDGTLCDWGWYARYFDKLRVLFPKLRIGIIHVTAPVDAILQRISDRANVTGRVIPRHVLLNSIEQVPKSILVLRKQVDFFLEIANNQNSIQVVSSGLFATNESSPIYAWVESSFGFANRTTGKQTIAVPAT